MVARKGPTLRSQLLGKQLREYRESAGQTMKQAGEYLQRDQATVSRIEAGIIPCRAADAMSLLTLYGISDSQLRAGLDQFCRDLWQQGWWDGYAEAFPGRTIDHAWLEARADALRSYDAMCVPGLLQTKDYAEVVIRAADPGVSAERIGTWIEFRMGRQQALSRENPLLISAILDEATLRRTIGSRAVLNSQLHALLAVMDLPNVTIQVLPFETAKHPSPEGPFTIFDMPAPFPDIAYVESRGGDIYVEAEGVNSFSEAYDRLQEAALSPGESHDFIAEIAGHMEV